MSTVPPSAGVNDLLEAVAFAERRFTDWHQARMIGDRQLDAALDRYKGLRERIERATDPSSLGLPGLARPEPNESPAARSLRYHNFLDVEVRRFADRGVLRLAQSHSLLDEVRERRRALGRRLRPDEIPEVIPVAELERDELAPPPPRRRRAETSAYPDAPPAEPPRPLIEIVLDPRNIQYLLTFGGALMVIGVVILLYVNNFFTPATAAIGLAAGNAALLLGGWWLLRGTSFQLAGRALALLACLVMPLNLWYLQQERTVEAVGEWARMDQYLWVVAVVIAVLYLASALVLRDELFVWVSCAGVTMAGLLIIATLPDAQLQFRAIAYPSALLVGLGLLGIHLERLFPDGGEGAFTRKRFGLAFFWSGHIQLGAGLLMLLGAFIVGDWLYPGLQQFVGWTWTPSPVVDPEQLLWLSIALVGLGTYAYVYSDVVVRKLGVYVHVAAVTLTWLLVMVLKQLNVNMGVEVLIAILAGAALMINLAQAFAFGDSRYTRAFPVLGLLLPLAAVLIGAVFYLRYVLPPLIHHLGKLEFEVDPKLGFWPFVGAMALTAVSCRVGAWVYRTQQPALAAVYHFATGAAVMTGAATLLTALGLGGEHPWQDHVPLLMIVPILYVLAARLYRGGPTAEPLVWVAHAATVLLLIASLSTALPGFFNPRTQDPLNLMLALFFAEVTLFYALCAGLHRQAVGVPFAAAAACGALWQLCNYKDVQPEIYVLVFAAVGIVLLVVYWTTALSERVGETMTQTAFGTGNTLLVLAFASAALMGMARLPELALQQEPAVMWPFTGMCAALAVLALGAVFLVRHPVWRVPLHVIAAIGMTALALLSIVVTLRLSPLQKVELVCVALGTLLLIASHVGWYREQERESELVTLGLLFGSFLVGFPLAIATIVDRSGGRTEMVNELSWLAASVLLFATGFIFRLRVTTIVGALSLAVYLGTLLLLVPWSRMEQRVGAVAAVLAVGGGGIFVLGLLLSVFRESLLKLPDRIRNREGVFEVLRWR